MCVCALMHLCVYALYSNRSDPMSATGRAETKSGVRSLIGSGLGNRHSG